MYRKKEWIFAGIGIIFFLFLGICQFINQVPETEENEVNSPSPIVIELTGEINKDVELKYSKPITYGFLWIQIKSLLNEYSDLSSFSTTELIIESLHIVIPSLDKKSNSISTTTSKININKASKTELINLPQIGEKRSERILNYIKEFGPIKTFEELWEVIGIVNPKTQKEIMAKAILQ